MNINDNGIVREMTADEIKMFENMSAAQPTLEDKVNALMEFMGVTGRWTGTGRFEVVKAEMPEGDYTHPIQIPAEGLTTTAGLWYYTDDKDLPHEAVQSAFVTPDDFGNKTFFDFVE